MSEFPEFATISRFVGYRFGRDGTIWSRRYARGLGKRWKNVRGRYDSHGRRQAVLKCVDGSLVTGYIARFILEAFIGPCPPGMEACHNDGDHENNAITNLRWDTHVGNMVDRKTHGREVDNRGENNASAKVTERIVKRIRAFRHIYTRKQLASKYGLTVMAVSYIQRHKTWRHVK